MPKIEMLNPNIGENFMSRRLAVRGKKTDVMLAFVRQGGRFGHFESTETNLNLFDPLLDYCAGRVDWVQIHGGSVYELSPLAQYPGTSHAVNPQTLAQFHKIIENCHARGIRVSWMPGQINPPPGLLEKYPDLRNLQTGNFWQLLHNCVSDTFDALPELDEFATFFFESAEVVHQQNFFKNFYYGDDAKTDWINNWPYLSYGDHLRLVLQAMSRACRERGKSFSLLTHVWYPFQDDLLLEALRDFPSDLPLILEHNYSTGDMNPYLPAPRLMQALPHLHHCLLFCGGLEYNGLSDLPFCMPELTQELVAWGHEQTPNLERLTIRPVWSGRSLLNTPNEINLEAVLALARDPLTDTDELWHHWAARRYGAGVAQEMAAALRLTFEANRRAMFTLGVRTNNHSYLPTFNYLQSRLINYAKALAEWVPTPHNRQNMLEFAVQPGEKIIRIVREEHESALKDLCEARGRIENLAGWLNPQDSAQLVKMLSDSMDWVTLHSLQLQAYLRFRKQFHQASPENRARCLTLLDELEQSARKIWSERPDASDLLGLEIVLGFVQDIRENLI